MSRKPVAGPIVIPNGTLVVVTYANLERVWHNTFHAINQAAGPLNPAIAETIFSGIKAQAGTTGWLAHMAAGADITGVHMKDLRAANNPILFSTSASVAGTAPDAAISLATAFVVTLLTASSGRAFRGRAYLAGLTIGALANSTHAAVAVGPAAIAYVQGIQTVLSTNNLQLGIAQRALQAGTDIHDNPLPARPAAMVPVTGFANTNNRIDSQRRRLGR
jgi:hypothetical protein